MPTEPEVIQLRRFYFHINHYECLIFWACFPSLGPQAKPRELYLLNLTQNMEQIPWRHQNEIQINQRLKDSSLVH